MNNDQRVRTFSARVTELRHAAGLTQAELAAMAEVTVETVARLERAVRGSASANTNPSLETVWKIADALGVDVTVLLTPKPGKSEVDARRKLRLEGLSRITHELEALRRLA